MSNLQAIFDRTVLGLRKQGCKAQDIEGVCKYRIVCDGQVLKCAAGFQIPDEDYRPEFEGFDICAAASSSPVFKYFQSHFSPREFDLIADLQGVHDDSGFEFWEGSFREIALEYDLVYPAG